VQRRRRVAQCGGSVRHVARSDERVDFERIAGNGQLPFVAAMQAVLRAADRLEGLQPAMRRAAHAHRAL